MSKEATLYCSCSLYLSEIIHLYTDYNSLTRNFVMNINVFKEKPHSKHIEMNMTCFSDYNKRQFPRTF